THHRMVLLAARVGVLYTLIATAAFGYILIYTPDDAWVPDAAGHLGVTATFVRGIAYLPAPAPTPASLLPFVAPPRPPPPTARPRDGGAGRAVDRVRGLGCGDNGGGELAVSDPVLVAATVAALAAVVVWFDVRLLSDLASTPEPALRYFNRTTWALIIVVTFP